MMHTTDDHNCVVTDHPFAGLVDGEERFAKAQLALQINLLIKERRLTQTDAAKLLGITQPEVSHLNNGRLSGFTLDRLCRCLYSLNMDIEIRLKRHLSTDTQAGIQVIGFA